MTERYTIWVRNLSWALYVYVLPEIWRKGTHYGLETIYEIYMYILPEIWRKGTRYGVETFHELYSICIRTRNMTERYTLWIGNHSWALYVYTYQKYDGKIHNIGKKLKLFMSSTYTVCTYYLRQFLYKFWNQRKIADFFKYPYRPIWRRKKFDPTLWLFLFFGLKNSFPGRKKIK
jgi:hypothetical protein